jgi:predicted nucleic acid-binding protein
VIQGLRPPERQVAEALFAAIDWVALTEALARRAGKLGRQWRGSHPGIGVADLAIAATAEQFDGGLATRNVKRFPMFADLRPPY